MTETVLVRDLLDLPERIHKGDYVLQLTQGIADAEQTSATYVVTPALCDALDRALSQVTKALSSGTSHSAYLHGSFGSGKSHFMALLSLLMNGSERAWRIAELHALRGKHPFVGEKKLLQLHFHMVGQPSIEAAVFGQYLAYVGKHHPDAGVPGLFADEKLFADAGRVLDELGDEAFFAPMNEGGGGRLRRSTSTGGWNRERFARAAASTDPKEREQLFSALVKTRYSSFARESRAYIDFDTGLAVMSRHAAELGYCAIVLFLDELILWLAAHAADSAWLHQEVQKMAKLVEAQESGRAIPIVSFIARQRDLAEMVGPDYAGAENKSLQDMLKFWDGRFDTIRLEDRNLPMIIERRVLRTKSDAARAQLDDAFKRLERESGTSWQVMLGTLDGEAFRKVYPFSPALVDALVALSSFLQRERTAIKVLMELLVEHATDLTLGEVVRVGDLFDVLAEGADATDGAMKGRFDAAKQLYKYRFLPLIQQENGTTDETRCQRMRDNHPVRLGCSGCREKACRNDNRILKTLLIAALVPEVKPLRDMTAGKLVALNHGSLKVPVAGTEPGVVAAKLKRWASTIGQPQVGDQADPSVALQLEGVDTAAILTRAQDVDSGGARQRMLRELLFERMGVEDVVDWGVDHTFKYWRETERKGHIRFGNVRKLPPEQLKCPDGHEWRLVIDYPFDDPGYGPHHDQEVAERVKEDGVGTWTLVWLPSFFSETVNRLVGELVILDHVLGTRESTRKYTAHLSVEQQERARTDLENLQSAKKARVCRALEQAYGLARAEEENLDPARSLDGHVLVLKPGASVPGDAASNLADALDRYVPELLKARYPRHPELTHKLSPKLVSELVDRFGDIIDAEDKRIPADKQLAEKMAGTLGLLGLVRVTEGAVHLVPDKMLQALDNRREQKSVQDPSVEELRDWLDENRRMGLQPAAEDLVVRCYARWAARTLVLNGKPFTPDGRQPIPDAVVLERPDLPSQQDWAKALAALGTVLLESFPGRALHADNLKRFEAKVNDVVKRHGLAARQLPDLLAQRARELKLGEDMDRAITARACKALIERLDGQTGKTLVEALSGLEPKTSGRAMGESLRSAAPSVGALQDRLSFGVFEQLRTRGGDLNGAAELLEDVARLLRQDEVNSSLATGWKRLAEQGQRLLQDSAPQPQPQPAPAPASTVVQLEASESSRQAALGALDALVSEAKGKLEGEDEGAFTVRVQVVRKERGER